jgi:hypothetical protein
MMHLIPALFTLVALTALFGGAGCKQKSPSVVESGRQTMQAKMDGGSDAGSLALEQRRLLSQSDRLRWLERNGIVPDDADGVDWQLAQQTSWWGKPIDAKEFWKDRTLWRNRSAQKDAMRRGRMYPPVPLNDEGFAGYSDEDVAGPLAAVDGPSLSLHRTERESAFWNHFDLTHPMYPEEIDREQRRVAAKYHRTLKLVNLNSNDVDQVKTTLRSEPMTRNYPAEAFTEEALFWAYVLEAREEYTGQIAPFIAVKPSVATNWLGRQPFDPKLVAEPLTEEQLKTANAWKISYLQRLRREKVDESYINAYLKAWNLTPTQVFGAN